MVHRQNFLYMIRINSQCVFRLFWWTLRCFVMIIRAFYSMPLSTHKATCIPVNRVSFISQPVYAIWQKIRELKPPWLCQHDFDFWATLMESFQSYFAFQALNCSDASVSKAKIQISSPVIMCFKKELPWENISGHLNTFLFLEQLEKQRILKNH